MMMSYEPVVPTLYYEHRESRWAFDSFSVSFSGCDPAQDDAGSLKGLMMSVEQAEPEERPCLHCMFVDLIDEFFAQYKAASDDADAIDADEVIDAIAKTVAELTSGQDGSGRQQITELLMKQIMKYDDEFRRENDAGSSARH
jgi:hypothetical protein